LNDGTSAQQTTANLSLASVEGSLLVVEAILAGIEKDKNKATRSAR